MSSIPFYKVSPSGNTTLLFEDMSLSVDAQQFFVAQALREGHLGGEQAGFIDCGEGILRMAGGEFCLNATRALGLVMAIRAGLDNARMPQWHGSVRASGMDSPMTISVNAAKHGNEHEVFLNMPCKWGDVHAEHVGAGVHILRLPGVIHLLIEKSVIPFREDTWQQDAHTLRAKYGLEQENAVGCIWWGMEQKQRREPNASADDMIMTLAIHPVVRILHPYTECYENACGSGTVALSLMLFHTQQCRYFEVHQPGGPLTVLIEGSGDDLTAIVGGPVSMVAQGQAFF